MLWWTLKQLTSSKEGTRVEAAARLAASGNRKAVPALIRALSDDSAPVRLAVIKALAAMRHPAAAEALAAALARMSQQPKGRGKGRDPASRSAEFEALAAALGALGTAAPPLLSRLLSAEDHETRRWAAHALGLMRDPEAAAPLIQKLDDQRSEVRKAAALALGAIGDVRALNPLIKSVGSRDQETRRAAVVALGMIGNEAAAGALTAVLEDPSETFQLAAVTSLGQIGGLRGALGLRVAIDGGRRRVQEAAAGALKSLDLAPANAEERALAAILKGDFQAALQLGETAAGALVQALASRDASRRRQAAQALGELHSPASLEPLLQAVKDRDAAVQDAAAAALGQLGPAAVDSLAVLLAHHDAAVQLRACRALGDIGDPLAAGPLAAVIEHNLTIPHEYPDPVEVVRTSVAALMVILKRSAPEMTVEDLQRIAALPDARLQSAPGGVPEIAADGAPVRELARQELSRRGL